MSSTIKPTMLSWKDICFSFSSRSVLWIVCPVVSLLRRSGLAGIGMTKRAGELIAAQPGLDDGPAVVADDVMVSAKRAEVVFSGRPFFAPGLVVVEVTAGGGHPAAGKDTGRVESLSQSPLADGGPTPRGANRDRTPVLIGDRVAPLGSDLFLGDSAGDVGDDRSPSR